MNLPLKAHVKDGQLVLEDPSTALPEGTVVTLYPELDDDLDEEEQEQLEAFLEGSMQSAREGKTVTHEELMQRLQKLP